MHDASIITAPNQTSFTGNHDSSKGDSSDSEGSNDIKVLINIRAKFAKKVIICHLNINSINLIIKDKLVIIDLFTDSDAIFEMSIWQCIMVYSGYMKSKQTRYRTT